MNLFLAVKNRTLIIDDVKNFSLTTDSRTDNSVTEQEWYWESASKQKFWKQIEVRESVEDKDPVLSWKMIWTRINIICHRTIYGVVLKTIKLAVHINCSFIYKKGNFTPWFDRKLSSLTKPDTGSDRMSDSDSKISTTLLNICNVYKNRCNSGANDSFKIPLVLLWCCIHLPWRRSLIWPN